MWESLKTKSERVKNEYICLKSKLDSSNPDKGGLSDKSDRMRASKSKYF